MKSFGIFPRVLHQCICCGSGGSHEDHNIRLSGHCCSKLMMSVVNETLLYPKSIPFLAEKIGGASKAAFIFYGKKNTAIDL